MADILKNLDIGVYDGVADFLLHASVAEKKEVMTEAARRANTDQRKIMDAAQNKYRERDVVGAR
jgi:hypothetical protein